MTIVASKLRFNSLVVSDLQRAVDWYERHSLAAANRFRAAAQVALERIAKSPKQSAVVFEDLDARLFRIPRFPYLVLYRVSGQVVVIEGIFHSSTDPGDWRRRADDS
jgi:plasmid stabilization system protein ParE